MNGAALYAVFLGMKLHFTQRGYDYPTYGPRPIGEEKLGRNYVLANALAGKFQTKAALELRLLSLFKNKVVWLDELDTPSARKAEANHLKVTNGFYYLLEQELETIRNERGQIIEALKAPSPFEVPAIGRLLLNNQISLETYVALDNLIPFSKDINDVIWSANKIKAEKYKAFFKPDMKRVAKIARPFFDK